MLNSSIATVSSSPRTARPIDLENLTYNTDSERISAHALGARLDEVLSLASPVQHRLVAAQRHLLLRDGAKLAARNLRWQQYPSGPDEADRALMEVGLGPLLRGFRRIVVASGDHSFAPFGDLCDLRIAMARGVGVSARLASAGTVLTAAREAAIRVARTVEVSTTRPGIPVPAAA